MLVHHMYVLFACTLCSNCPHGVVVVYSTSWDWEDQWITELMDKMNAHYIPGAGARILGKYEY